MLTGQRKKKKKKKENGVKYRVAAQLKILYMSNGINH